MKVNIYEEIFEVTETCGNGNERTIKKSVFCMPYDEKNGCKIHRTESDRILLATQTLKQERYYNIKYIKTVVKTVLKA